MKKYVTVAIAEVLKVRLEEARKTMKGDLADVGNIRRCLTDPKEEGNVMAMKAVRMMAKNHLGIITDLQDWVNESLYTEDRLEKPSKIMFNGAEIPGAEVTFGLTPHITLQCPAKEQVFALFAEEAVLDATLTLTYGEDEKHTYSIFYVENSCGDVVGLRYL